jgi:hypothetical protein
VKYDGEVIQSSAKAVNARDRILAQTNVQRARFMRRTSTKKSQTTNCKIGHGFLIPVSFAGASRIVPHDRRNVRRTGRGRESFSMSAHVATDGKTHDPPTWKKSPDPVDPANQRDFP